MYVIPTYLVTHETTGDTATHLVLPTFTLSNGTAHLVLPTLTLTNGTTHLALRELLAEIRD